MKRTQHKKARRVVRKKKTVTPRREHQEKVLDDALDNTFPASDPVSLTEPAPKHDPTPKEPPAAQP